MFLHRIYLDPRCREARRDLADPYQLHSTLCRAFSAPAQKCPEGEFLWRLEPETDPSGNPRILVQSRSIPDWTQIGVKGWLMMADPAVDLKNRFTLESLKIGQCFRFRLRANPCVTRGGKRLGLLKREEQEAWIIRKGEQHGFSLTKLPTSDLSEDAQNCIHVRISQEQILRGKQHSGNQLSVFSVLFDGILAITDPNKFMIAIQTGIGHGKAIGLGLLSLAPVPLQ
jgi:CRISPR system Cascade subunit CasE